jgi:two-component system response regulator AtoC
MRDLYGRLERIAPLEEPVLVLGETGTGKELVAQEIHVRSGRDGPLLPINCAALPPELLESELFGHERGAFSGAITGRRGLLAEGGTGTVFLDEIGDLPLPAQARLLRVLEELKVRPVGSNRWQPVQARLLLATNRDLEKACAAGTFRLDLFYRINGFTLRLPPLRERKADLLLLAHYFLGGFNRKYGREVMAPSGAFDLLFRHDWPGNVRELQKAVWEAAGSASGDRGPISLVILQEATRRRPTAAAVSRPLPFDPAVETWEEVHDRIRASYFRSVLRLTGGNKNAAAKRAGVSRSQFYEILKQIEQTPEPERDDNDEE